MFHMTITIDGVDRFVTHPEHDTNDFEGYLRCEAFGGELPIEAGTFNLFVHFFDFLKQLTTFRTEGPTLSDRASAMGRFGRLFMGKLWDVYARNVLTAGPL